MKRLITSMIGILVAFSVFAQPTFPQNGVYDHREGLYAFTNATIHTSYKQTTENATLIIREGKIEAVGVGTAIPKGAVVIDLKGKHIYPSFIDLYNQYGLKKAKAVGTRPRQQPQMLSNKAGAYLWNEAIKPEFSAAKAFTVDYKAAEGLRKLGFGGVLTHQQDGINRGTGAFTLLSNQNEHSAILKENAGQFLSFSKGVSTQAYPSSLMGSIALLRQTYLDANWYQRSGNEKMRNLSLQAWNENARLPQFFRVRDRLEILRADKIAKEFGITYVYLGNGDEYMRMDDIRKTGAALVIPIDFPAAFDVQDPFDALQADLSDMKHWELAPTNPAELAKANIEFAFTLEGLKNKSDYIKNIKKAIKHGLSEEAALKAMTFTPAKLAGVIDQVGTLEQGKIANFIVTSDGLFEDEMVIHHNWVNGQPDVLKALTTTDLRGTYVLDYKSQSDTLTVSGDLEKLKFSLKINDSTTLKVKHRFNNGLVSFSFNDDNGITALSGTLLGKNWEGRGTLANGEWINWSATQVKVYEEKSEGESESEDESEKVAALGAVTYPFTAFGWESKPKQVTYLIKNTTVWTNESDGILENMDVLVEDGKIKKVGKDLKGKGAIEIDGTGKHLTSGIIDEHSHIAISRGVNEGTQMSSAEVRIGDVVNSEDINIYRQLAGGVTTSQLLHGSANPIGGQAALIKLRWGSTPEEMKFEGADGFIKFALGENVKQSNWGDNYRMRFPQTRMGVEQVYEDYFTRAREYEAAMKADPLSTRQDLELDCLLEILNKERFVTCHSYVQSEINMLMKMAESHGFVLNTFTHILEGYKVADKMKAHGAGGSSFSDWWAYKSEVLDAIPYNGALMHSQGVTVAFNSDDAEMARRLNQEAAKAVMYGGLSEEEAWKFVTLNPAKLLHVDDRVGSVKAGKDADIVLWSNNPLSIYARAEKTFVDGILLYDLELEAEKRVAVRVERARLIQKMLDAKIGGEATQPVRNNKKHLYHCGHLEQSGFLD
ncbi:MAG: imidazolonepropionase-like amidohydrolase [Cognaticolwellia sp.]|jgi:imidazolonepropionase-like amidohydrolase